MPQLELFENPSVPTATASRAESRRTKAETHKSVLPRSGAQREEVLRLIRESGASGMTRQEVADVSGFKLSAVCPRVHELLQGDEPLVYQTKERRNGANVVYAKGFA